MNDWTCYDEIAQTYEGVQAANTLRVARDLISLAPTDEVHRVLDLGAGTGAATQAALEIWPSAFVVGTDISLGMLRVGRQVRPGWHPMVAQAVRLPLSDQTLDLVTANFVLSHLRAYEEALLEIRRVLRPEGRFAASAWGAPEEEPRKLWRELAEEILSPTEVAEAIAAVVPAEERFSTPPPLQEALMRTGFHSVVIETRPYQFCVSLEDYLTGREATAIGRRLRELLSAGQCLAFHHKARRILSDTFGSPILYSRPVLLAIGTRP